MADAFVNVQVLDAVHVECDELERLQDSVGKNHNDDNGEQQNEDRQQRDLHNRRLQWPDEIVDGYQHTDHP